MTVQLKGRSPYAGKDQLKADNATCFIGQGSAASSTAQYARDFGDLANKGTYTANDRVFISVEGARRNRVDFDTNEIKKAVDAGATLITDSPYHRNRPYNLVGEGRLAAFLRDCGCTETIHQGYSTWKNGSS
ncbi:hypothetical protein KC887_02115 [Candidatus Kaiserbacteria bacterium]|nr:hypothetical protein [Candidatus Kaiserbacteria bacterium]